MATLTSTTDWTGREINGVILGEPAVSDDGLTYTWDHPAIPGDVIDTEGDIWAEVPTEEVPNAPAP
jgi:hypothetical protein